MKRVVTGCLFPLKDKVGEVQAVGEEVMVEVGEVGKPAREEQAGVTKVDSAVVIKVGRGGR